MTTRRERVEASILSLSLYTRQTNNKQKQKRRGRRQQPKTKYIHRAKKTKMEMKQKTKTQVGEAAAASKTSSAPSQQNARLSVYRRIGGWWTRANKWETRARESCQPLPKSREFLVRHHQRPRSKDVGKTKKKNKNKTQSSGYSVVYSVIQHHPGYNKDIYTRTLFPLYISLLSSFNERTFLT